MKKIDGFMVWLVVIAGLGGYIMGFYEGGRLDKGEWSWYLNPYGNDQTCVGNDKDKPCKTYERVNLCLRPGDRVVFDKWPIEEEKGK